MTSLGLGIVTGESLNLRKTPNQKNISNTITQLHQYDCFSIVDDLGEWYKVKYKENLPYFIVVSVFSIPFDW